MERIMRRCIPWLGSAVAHALALIVLAWWLVFLPAQRGPLGLDLGAAERALPPALLEADIPELPTALLAEPRELLEPAESPLEPVDPAALMARTATGAGHSLDARFASMRSGRRGGAVEFFGTVAQGQRIVFILDISGSMGQNAYTDADGRTTRFERARRELVRTISRLYAEQEFVVLLFSDGCRPMFDMPIQRVRFHAATPTHKDRVGQWLEDIYPAGATDPRTSLQAAIALYPDAIFLLSDGEFKVGREGRIGDRVIRLVRGLNKHHGVPIHAIAYQDRRSRATLEAIAKTTGGTFRFVE
jgi:hypothetical protein